MQAVRRMYIAAGCEVLIVGIDTLQNSRLHEGARVKEIQHFAYLIVFHTYSDTSDSLENS